MSYVSVFFVAAICSLHFRLLLFAASASAEQSTPSPNSRKCPAVDGRSETCVCQHDKGIIDVTPLANNDGTAKFTDITDSQGYSYDYNPCNTFKAEHCKKKEVFNCQIDGGNGYIIGDAGTEEMWIDTDGTPYLYYTTRENRQLWVYLKCDRSARTPIATTEGDSQLLLQYVINITSCQVCPGGCEPIPPPVPSISIPILCPPIPEEPSCVCVHPKGIINLTPYANVSGKATFSVGVGNGTATYHYNPCQTFRMSKCWNTHICMMSSNNTLALANMGTEKIYIDSSSNEVFVQYTGPAEMPHRVYLECDHSVPRDSPSLSLRSSDSVCPSSMLVNLVLKSCQVCPGGC